MHSERFSSFNGSEHVTELERRVAKLSAELSSRLEGIDQEKLLEIARTSEGQSRLLKSYDALRRHIITLGSVFSAGGIIFITAAIDGVDQQALRDAAAVGGLAGVAGWVGALQHAISLTRRLSTVGSSPRRNEL